MAKFGKLTALLLSAVLLVCSFTVPASAASAIPLVSGEEVVFEQVGGKTTTYQFTTSEDGELEIKIKAESAWSTMNVIDKKSGDVIIPMIEPDEKYGISGVTRGWSYFDDKKFNAVMLFWESNSEPHNLTGTFKYFLPKGTYYLKIKTLLPKEAFQPEEYAKYIKEGNKNESYGRYTFTATFPTKSLITGFTISLKKGSSMTLGLVSESGEPDTIKWSSANKKIVSVTSKGVITANRKGKTVITAKVDGKAITITVNVTV